MKKFIALFIVTLLFFGVSHGANKLETLIPKTFKVKVYEFNKSTYTFYYESFGSAVLVKKGLLLTNAHVVVDFDNPKKEYYYEVCNSNSFVNKPDNCYRGYLVNYNKDTDLATIRIETKG